MFEAALPYTVVTNQQLYARPMYDRTLGRFKRSAKRKGKAAYQITTPYGLYNLLQGDNAPDLYGLVSEIIGANLGRKWTCSHFLGYWQHRNCRFWFQVLWVNSL